MVNGLFNKAMLYKMLPIGPNPIGLVEVRGITKRKKRQVDLTVDSVTSSFCLVPCPDAARRQASRAWESTGPDRSAF